MRQMKMLTAVFLIVLAPGLLLAVPGRSSNNTAGRQESVAVPKTEGQEEVSVPQTGDEAVEDLSLKPGDLAPKFALRDTKGNYELLTRWSGEKLSRPASQPIRHAVVVSFFATWCKPCMKELPHLQNLYKKYDGQDVKFFLIDITEATRSVEGFEDSPKAGPFLAKKGITIPILIDVYGMAKKNYGATTLPRLYVIDKLRKIRLAKQGFHEGEDFEGELSSMIDVLLAEEGSE